MRVYRCRQDGQTRWACVGDYRTCWRRGVTCRQHAEHSRCQSLSATEWYSRAPVSLCTTVDPRPPTTTLTDSDTALTGRPPLPLLLLQTSAVNIFNIVSIRHVAWDFWVVFSVLGDFSVFERDHTAKLALSIVRDATAAIFLGSMVQLITQRLSSRPDSLPNTNSKSHLASQIQNQHAASVTIGSVQNHLWHLLTLALSEATHSTVVDTTTLCRVKLRHRVYGHDTITILWV